MFAAGENDICADKISKTSLSLKFGGYAKLRV